MMSELVFYLLSSIEGQGFVGVAKIERKLTRSWPKISRFSFHPDYKKVIGQQSWKLVDQKQSNLKEGE